MERVCAVYTIPNTLRWENGPTTVTLRQLSTGEELQASKIGGFDLMKAQYEATKRSLYLLDGKPLDQANAEADKFWEACGPRMRSLLLKAFNKLTSPTEEDDSGFFASEKIQVGG